MIDSNSLYEVHLTELCERPVESARRLGREFFPDLSAWDLESAHFEARTRSRRQGEEYVVELQLEGEVRLECDRCLQAFDLPLRYEGALRIRYDQGGATLLEGDDWVVGPGVQTIDIAPYIRESVYLSIPMRHYHGMNGTQEADCHEGTRRFILNPGQDRDTQEISTLGGLAGPELEAVRQRLLEDVGEKTQKQGTRR